MRARIKQIIIKDVLLFYLRENERLKLQSVSMEYWGNGEPKKYQEFKTYRDIYNGMVKDVKTKKDIRNINWSIPEDIEMQGKEKEFEKKLYKKIEDRYSDKEKDGTWKGINLEQISFQTFSLVCNALAAEGAIIKDEETNVITYKEIDYSYTKQIYPLLLIAKHIAIRVVVNDDFCTLIMDDIYIKAVARWLNEVFTIEKKGAYCISTETALMIISTGISKEQGIKENVCIETYVFELLRCRKFKLV